MSQLTFVVPGYGTLQWHEALNAILAEIKAAHNDMDDEVVGGRGTAEDLPTRLDVSLNPDGTMKYSSGATDWFSEDQTVTQTTTRQFTVPADRSQIYVQGRRVLFNGSAAGFVAADSVYSGGVTTVNVWGCDVPAVIGTLQYGQAPTAASAVPVQMHFEALDVTSATYGTDGRIERMDFSPGNKLLFNYTGDSLTSVQYYDFDGTTLIATNTFTYDGNGNVAGNTWS